LFTDGLRSAYKSVNQYRALRTTLILALRANKFEEDITFSYRVDKK